MVSRADIRALNGQMSELIDAIDELEELHADSQREGVTVDPVAYADAQERVKEAVAILVNDADDMVERTDRLEDSAGNTLVSLPNAALARSGNSKPLPGRPTSGQGSGN